MATVMRKPFPVLTSLTIILKDPNQPVLPARFLGGSAPRLQEFILSGVPYPTLPTLLLSASDLVSLQLFNIPPTDCMSPKVMAASLAALPRLKFLSIFFQSATPPPDQIHPPPITRTVLPALTDFLFKGASDYLEDLVSRIDGPQLYQISTLYLGQLVDIQVPQLSEFLDRSVGPEFGVFKFALVTFYSGVSFYVGRHASPNHLVWNCIFDKVSDWQVSRIAQALSQISPALSNVVHLKLAELEEGRYIYGIDGIEWLHLLHQFSSVQTLHAYPQLAGYVALVLEDIVAEMVTEVLPSLDLICLEDQPASSIEKFVTARRLSGRPVTVINTETEFTAAAALGVISLHLSLRLVKHGMSDADGAGAPSAEESRTTQILVLAHSGKGSRKARKIAGVATTRNTTDDKFSFDDDDDEPPPAERHRQPLRNVTRPFGISESSSDTELEIANDPLPLSKNAPARPQL
ncbi:hypothetical protein EDB84DRAFT_1565599 [Lactarius hengduanensis]|nr:hypothetical protein EDB84DRAFT_1565599 [Lactarius hengduanensis]